MDSLRNLSSNIGYLKNLRGFMNRSYIVFGRSVQTFHIPIVVLWCTVHSMGIFHTTLLFILSKAFSRSTQHQVIVFTEFSSLIFLWYSLFFSSSLYIPKLFLYFSAYFPSCTYEIISQWYNIFIFIFLILQSQWYLFLLLQTFDRIVFCFS